jgi:lipopolysaccharide export system protein LptA
MSWALLLVAVLAQAPSSEDAQRPVAITADRLEIRGKKNQAVWVGRVKAVRGETRLSCDRLVAHYNAQKEVNRLECMGHVEVTEGDRWAKGERADFDNITGLLIVTGSPEARQGKNHMKGTQVVFNIGKDTLEVKDATTLFETTPQLSPPPATRAKRKAPNP